MSQVNLNEVRVKRMMINTSVLDIPRYSYQRSLRPSCVEGIAKHFSEYQANEPKVSFRDGQYYVFDGQNTISGRKALNGGEDLDILCKVFYGLTEQEEAILFAEQDDYSTPLTAGIKLRAKVYGEDPEAIAFKNATDSTGLILDYNQRSGTNRIGCIRTAQTEYRTVGEECYIEALKILKEAWGGEGDAFRAPNITGLCRFVSLYQHEYDRRRLISRLRGVDPLAISREGKSVGTGLKGYKRYLYQVYRIYNGSSKVKALPMKF